VPGTHDIQVEVHERDTGSAGKQITFTEKMDFVPAEVKLLDYDPNQVRLFRRVLSPTVSNETGKE
jgi:hypothetical protein